MALQLPSLTKDGAVSFGSSGDFDVHWTTYVQKGALPVKPERALSPLEQLDVFLVCPGLPVPVALKVEVVQLQPERALLRLLEPAPPKPTVAAATEPAPAPEPPPRTTTVDYTKAPAWEPAPPLSTPARPKERAAQTQDLDLLMPSPSSDEGLPQILPLPRSPTPMPVLVLERIADDAPKPTPQVVAEADAPPPSKRPVTMVPLPPIVLAEADAKPSAPAPAPAPIPEAVAAPPAAAQAPAAMTPSKPQALPPFFTLESLRFQSAADFQAGRPHLETVGAIVAVADGSLPTKPVEILLAVGEKTSKSKVKVTLSAAAPGTAVVQAATKGGFAPLLTELDQQNASATGNVPATSSSLTGAFTPVPGIQQRNFTLPRQGALQNPMTAEGILALPMTRSPTDAELVTPSVPLLLRWLRTTRGTLRLEVTAADHPVFTAVFVDGREVRTPASLSTLGKSLALAKMSYSIIDLGRPPTMTTSGRTLHLIAETIRALCGLCAIEDLARVFPRRGNLCPRAVNDIVAGLGLPSQHQRFIKTDVDGSQFLDEIARAAVGGRTVWETLYLLEIFNGLTWDEPPEGKKQTRTGPVTLPTRERTGAYAAPDDAAWFSFEGKDHFGVLGLHWSSSPTEVTPAYQKLKSEYGVNGMKRPQNRDVAEKIVKRIEEAYKVLNDPNARRAYRREKFNLVWSHQAQLLVQKAKLALYRKDLQEAMNALLAAEDMSPSEEARGMLSSIKQKLTGGSGGG